MLARITLPILGAALAAAVSPSFGEPIAVEAKAVPLNPFDPDATTVGQLEYRAGLALRSPDKRFGGLSAMSVSADGRLLTALSDLGHWLRLHLAHDQTGSVSGVSAAEIGPLLDLRGRPLEGKPRQDAESMAVLPNGSLLVAFEHEHRLWSYVSHGRPLLARAEEFRVPPELGRAPTNSGLEAITRLADGRLLALTEDLVEGGAIRGWLWQAGRWSSLAYRIDGTPRPSGAALLPSGDALVLERSYAPLLGNAIRLRRIPAGAIVAGAILDGEVLAELRLPLSVDNFEAVDCRLGEDGATLVYLLSDDNFNPAQRTLLLTFALRGTPLERDAHPNR